jgi:hypothetical protein
VNNPLTHCLHRYLSFKTAEKVIATCSIPTLTAPSSTKIQRKIYNMVVTDLLNSSLGTTGQPPTKPPALRCTWDNCEFSSLSPVDLANHFTKHSQVLAQWVQPSGCLWQGCKPKVIFKTLSLYNTHLWNVHLKEQKYECSDEISDSETRNGLPPVVGLYNLQYTNPSTGSNTLCKRWSSVPKGKDYLVARTSTLKQICREDGDMDSKPMELAHGIYWHGSETLFASCNCTHGNVSSGCDRVKFYRNHLSGQNDILSHFTVRMER